MKTKDVAIIIVRSTKGLFYIHRRRSNKKLFPSLYGFGAGGCIELGESPQAGAERELFEELKVSSAVEKLFHFYYESNIVSHETFVFSITYEGKIIPCKKEFQWSGWMSIDEVDSLAQNDKFVPDTKIVWEKYKKKYLDKK